MSRVTMFVIIALSLLSLLSAYQLGRISMAYQVAENPGSLLSCGNCDSEYNPSKGKVVAMCVPETKVIRVKECLK